MRRKHVIFLLVSIVLLLSAGGAYYYVASTASVTIRFENIKNVRMLEGGSLVRQSIRQGDTFRVKKAADYTLEYEAEPTYESGKRNFSVITSHKDIVLRPFYSSSKLADMLSTERVAIKKEFTSAYSNFEEVYQIEEDFLYEYGQWYGAKLRYIGQNPAQSDDVLVVAEKEGEAWHIVSQPYITVNTINNEGVPLDLLRKLNDLQINS